VCLRILLSVSLLFYPEDGSRKFRRSVHTYRRNYTASPSKVRYSYTGKVSVPVSPETRAILSSGFRDFSSVPPGRLRLIRP
jgi:hypothetical protein